MRVATENIYRESNRRRHKLFGAYLTFWAWVHKVDCIVLSAQTLLSYLELERMQNKRVDWMKNDLKKLFPYASAMHMTSSGVYATLYLSRLPFPNGFPWGSLNTKGRVERLNREGLKTKETMIPSEAKMITIFAKIMMGLDDFPLK